MRRIAGVCLWAGVTALSASPAAAQIGEFQIGPVASRAVATGYGQGGGVAGGLAAGRLAYLGLRWTSYLGHTTSYNPPVVCCGATTAVRDRVQAFAADLGVLIPAGPVEIIPGVSLGVLRFARRLTTALTSGGTGQTTSHVDEFLFTPGVAVQLYAGRFAVIPQLEYSLSGRPDQPGPPALRGPIVSLRVVMTFEASRIRR